MRLILASGSPRRLELLRSIGLNVEVEAPDVDERRMPDEAPGVYVERVAVEKAMTVAGQGRVVIGADTAVLHRGHLMGKPAHPAEARAMLSRLSGDAHTVLTGVAVAYVADVDTELVSAVESSVVHMTELTDTEIAAYVETGESMDKAGAYALQGLGAVLVEAVEGSPSNVIGLPLHVVARLLRSAGIEVIGGEFGPRSAE